jgi:ribosomal protein S18 acetylase RimI-like enzyme
MIFENTPSNPIEINRVKLEDLHELCVLSRQTFIDAFKDQNKEENISHFVEGAYTVENIGNQLNNPDSAFYFARPGPFGSISAVTGNQEESLGTGPDFFQHDSPVSSSDFIQRVNSIDSPENNRNPALGYMKINFGASQSDLQDFEALELERIYVDSNQLGKGIGQLLLDKAIEIARKAGLIYIWLGVWEHNLKARRFYTKNGFVQFDQHIFTLGNDDQTDLLLKKIL